MCGPLDGVPINGVVIRLQYSPKEMTRDERHEGVGNERRQSVDEWSGRLAITDYRSKVKTRA